MFMKRKKKAIKKQKMKYNWMIAIKLYFMNILKFLK